MIIGGLDKRESVRIIKRQKSQLEYSTNSFKIVYCLQESNVFSENSDETSMSTFFPITHSTKEGIPSRIMSPDAQSTSMVNRNTLALPTVAKVCD